MEVEEAGAVKTWSPCGKPWVFRSLRPVNTVFVSLDGRCRWVLGGVCERCNAGVEILNAATHTAGGSLPE